MAPHAMYHLPSRVRLCRFARRKAVVPRFLILGVMFNRLNPMKALKIAAMLLILALLVLGVGACIAKSHGEPVGKPLYWCKEKPCTPDEIKSWSNELKHHRYIRKHNVEARTHTTAPMSQLDACPPHHLPPPEHVPHPPVHPHSCPTACAPNYMHGPTAA